MQARLAGDAHESHPCPSQAAAVMHDQLAPWKMAKHNPHKLEGVPADRQCLPAIQTRSQPAESTTPGSQLSLALS